MGTLDANEAVASVAYRLNEFFAIYPITPSSPMAEFADEWSAAGKKNLWGAVPEVVFLNTSGGLTGGDRLSYGVALGDGCRAVATTQTAERAYLSNQGAARVEVSMTVGAGGWIDWLPQETILFERSALHRKLKSLGIHSNEEKLEIVA